MTRVAVVIGSALIFAILGPVAGHLCVVAYGGGVDSTLPARPCARRATAK